MRTSSSRVMGALAALCLLAGVAGCARVGTGGSGPQPFTPATFVLAWTDPAGGVHTMESRDGSAWLNQTRQAGTALRGPAVNGPGIAHDGNITWLLAWPTRVGPASRSTTGLALKVGVGGVPSDGQPGGVVWEDQGSTGPATSSIAGRPSVAFGDGRWFIAYRTANGGIELVRSQPNSVRAWDAPALVVVPPLPTTGVFSPDDPALTYGNGALVLAFREGGTVFAIRSTDGTSWSAPAAIGPSESFGPALAFRDGVFLAVLNRLSSTGSLSTLRFQAVRSSDGTSWSGPLGEGGNWDQQLRVPAAAAYGDGKLVLARRASASSPDVDLWVGQADRASLPSSITFTSPPRGIRLEDARSGPYGVSIAFGSSAPPAVARLR